MKEEVLIEALRANPFVLAPMAGITDNYFRSFMKEMGCGIVITELVSAHGINHASAKTIEILGYEGEQRPVGAQIFGEDEIVLGEAAKFAQSKGFDFIDINLGCPVPKVVKKGAGSALLKDPTHLEKILTGVRRQITIPLTIKVRTGWDQDSINAVEVVEAATRAGVLWVAIHGRTRAQGYSGKADWELIKKVKESSKIPIIGNGDIHSANLAIERLQSSGCDAVMIGRGCLKNPWIFDQTKALLSGLPPIVVDSALILKAIERLKVHLDKKKDLRYSGLQLKKLASWYSAGFPGASQFRRQVFAAHDAEQIMQTSTNFFSSLDFSHLSDTSSEPFLMGGHG